MEEGDEANFMDLPPGFRFHPTDEEIINEYLTPKVMDNNFTTIALGEVDLNKIEPWDLPKKAKMGEKEWYFFVQRDRKYPTGMRTNRATESGYWKATGKDKKIYKGRKGNCPVGMKKTLVFYKGRAPKGEKTNWVMHEYRLEGKFSYYNFPKPEKNEWVVCRVFHKSGIKSGPITRMNSFAMEDLLDSPNYSLPPLTDSPLLFSNNGRQTDGCSSFTEYGEEHDHIKGRATTSSSSITRISDGRDYLSYLNNDHINPLIAHNSTYQAYPRNPPHFNPLYPQTQLANPNFPFHAPPDDLVGYVHQERMGVLLPNFKETTSYWKPDQAILRAKHGASHGNVTTGSEISSSGQEISKKDVGSSIRSYDQGIEEPSVGGHEPISDFDYLFNY